MQRKKEEGDFLDSLVGKNEGEVLKAIYGYGNLLFSAGKFEEWNLLLLRVDISSTPTVLLLAYMTISCWAVPKLSNYRLFYKRVRRKLLRKEGYCRTRSLLCGLEPRGKTEVCYGILDAIEKSIGRF